jgi:hypothetical protein
MSPMPVRLEADAQLRVSDQAGRIVRSERLPAGSDLRERLRLAHENYQRQGWAVGELRPGQWAFTAEKADRRLLIAIREMPATALRTDVSVASDPIPRRTVS